MKKSDVSWDEYFLNIAQTVAQRSKDPSTKVGAVVADSRHRVIATGYNGFACGVYETEERWERPEKYNWVCHAELNALIYAGYSNAKWATLYCTHMPCDNCAKYIVQFGIKKIIIPKQLVKDPGSSVGKMETHARAEAMFEETGIRVKVI